MSERYPLEGLVGLMAERHHPDVKRGGCSCGFCAWSPEHAAIMAYREATDYRAPNTSTERWSCPFCNDPLIDHPKPECRRLERGGE